MNLPSLRFATVLLLVSLFLIRPVLADTQIADQIQIAEGDYEARKKMKIAQQLADEGKLDEALQALEEAKRQVKQSKRLFQADKLASTHEARLIKKERSEGELLRETDKFQKFFEIETYWLPPKPYDKDLNAAAEVNEETAVAQKAQKKIALIDFKDATIREVVDFFARAADVNIVMDENVASPEDRVSVYLKEIPMIEALDFVLKTKKLSYRIENNIILITNPANLGEELEVRVYDVQDLVGKLHDFPAQPFDFETITKKTSSGNGNGDGDGDGDGGGDGSDK